VVEASWGAKMPADEGVGVSVWVGNMDDESVNPPHFTLKLHTRDEGSISTSTALLGRQAPVRHYVPAMMKQAMRAETWMA